jgi:hypothetical protein
VTEREEHMRAQIGEIRRLCEDRVWGEEALQGRNVKLMASVPALLDWLTEMLDANTGLRRAVDKALTLTHIVGANGGMTDKDHATEAAIRREAGVG